MKTTKKILMILFAAMILAGSLTSCQKDKTKVNTDPNTNSIQNLSEDETKVTAAADQAIADINVVLGGGGSLKSTEMLPCNATIDSTAVANDTITIYITYNGLNCAQTVNRTGKIEIRKKVGTHWWQPGASVVYKYIDFHMTRISNNKSITLNGRKTYTNVTGGLVWMIGQTINGQTITSVTRRDEGYMTVTFDDNTSKFWNVARMITWTKDNGKFVTTVNGFGSADGYDNLIHWGTNRNEEAFYIQILQSVIHREACQWDPCSGQKKISIPGDNKGATITFGYDANNQPITNGDCPVKFRIDWFKNGNSGTIYKYLP